MDIGFLSEYVDIVILGICLCTGYVIKTSLDFVVNKYIPLVMLILGTSISIVCNLDKINAIVILSGMISGLASTGLYEAMRNLLQKKED